MNIKIIRPEGSERLDGVTAPLLNIKIKDMLKNITPPPAEHLISVIMNSGYSSPFRVIEVHLLALVNCERIFSWLIKHQLSDEEFITFENYLKRTIVTRKSLSRQVAESPMLSVS